MLIEIKFSSAVEQTYKRVLMRRKKAETLGSFIIRVFNKYPEPMNQISSDKFEIAEVILLRRNYLASQERENQMIIVRLLCCQYIYARTPMNLGTVETQSMFHEAAAFTDAMQRDLKLKLSCDDKIVSDNWELIKKVLEIKDPK